MLAKVGYGFAVAQYGLDSFENVYVLPAILGAQNDVGRWVGNLDEAPRNETKGLHGMRLGFYGQMVTVHLRLFAQFDAPEYTVVVGDVTASKKAEVQNGEFVELDGAWGRAAIRTASDQMSHK